MWTGRPRAKVRRTHDAKDPRKKNGRSEERPSSGRKRPGRAAASQSRIAIPRCNNMKKLRLVRKEQSITILDKTPQKRWKKPSQLPDFSSNAASFSTVATQHCVQRLTRQIHHTVASTQQKIRAKQLSPAEVEAGDTRWPKLLGSKMCWEASTPRAPHTRPQSRQTPRASTGTAQSSSPTHIWVRAAARPRR